MKNQQSKIKNILRTLLKKYNTSKTKKEDLEIKINKLLLSQLEPQESKQDSLIISNKIDQKTEKLTQMEKKNK